MKKLMSLVVVMMLILGLSTVAMATGSDDPAKWDTSVFEIPDEFYFSAEADPEDTYSRCYCTDIGCLGVNHYDKGNVAYFRWWGNMEIMPANVEENACCFTSAMTDQDTAVFWNGVPNLSKDLFKWWEGSVKDIFIPDSVTEIDEECFVEGSHITIHFTKNNEVALAYAQSRGMAFEVMDGERVSGDVDFDKSVDMKDVLCLRKSIASLPAAVEIYSTDLNADGSTDMKDVLVLRKQIATAAA